MKNDIQWMSLVRWRLSLLIQFTLVGALTLVAGAAIFVWPVIGKNHADRAERAQPVQSGAGLGTFRPTKEQWGGFKIEPVQLLTFRPEEVTEGSIAIDDNL